MSRYLVHHLDTGDEVADVGFAVLGFAGLVVLEVGRQGLLHCRFRALNVFDHSAFLNPLIGSVNLGLYVRMSKAGDGDQRENKGKFVHSKRIIGPQIYISAISYRKKNGQDTPAQAP